MITRWNQLRHFSETYFTPVHSPLQENDSVNAQFLIEPLVITTVEKLSLATVRFLSSTREQKLHADFLSHTVRHAVGVARQALTQVPY